MHKQSPKIEEVIAFTKWLSDKQISAKWAVWNLDYIALFGPFNKCLLNSKFYANFHTCRSWHQEQILFWKWRLTRPRLILKNWQPSLMVHTNPEFEKLRILILDLEFHQHLGSLKYVINIIMWVRDMRCYTWARVSALLALRLVWTLICGGTRFAGYRQVSLQFYLQTSFHGETHARNSYFIPVRSIFCLG
jgi:hypothetical protein